MNSPLGKSKKNSLRKQAENKLKKHSPKGFIPQDTTNLVHELQVHQFELEIQNEELRQSQADLIISRDKYQELFDSVPIGYFILNTQNIILEVNRTAAQMLYTTRDDMRRKRFSEFIAQDFQNIFYTEVIQVLKERKSRHFDLKMIRECDPPQFFTHVHVIPVKDSEGKSTQLRISIIDISERKIMEQELKDYAQKITRVQEEERKRIAYELHDDTAQYLSILKLEINALIQSGKIRDLEVLEKLRYLEKDAARAFNDIRRYSHELRPGVLEHLGLYASLEQLAEDINILNYFTVEVDVEGQEPELPEDVKLTFFHIAQEAMNNCRKHAKAPKVIIQLKFEGKYLKMAVIDNGVGFDVRKSVLQSKGKGNLGMMSMQERAKLIGADLKIESNPGLGTTVTLEMLVKD